MTNILLVDDQQHATVLAALRYYQEQGMGEPEKRSDDIHDIATCGDTVISLDTAAIDLLCEQINFTTPKEAALAAMKESGTQIGDCIRAYAVANEDPYVAKARELTVGDDDVEIDDSTVTSNGDDGAFVLCWMWVSNKEAGVPDTSEDADSAPKANLEEHHG